MVQSMSMNTLMISKCSIICGPNSEWRNSGQMKETHVFGVERLYLCSYGRRTLCFVGQSDKSRPRNMRVEAGWLFKGGNMGSDSDASCEHSESANEDILMFFFQLDLATRVQYALNVEQYDIAKQLRDKLTEVESEAVKLQENRKGSAAKSEVQDMAISLLRLRADLQIAIENENYKLAAELRDKISKLEAESLATSVKAQVYENVRYAFRLGQKVKHKIFGYRAVICGMDPVCFESKWWMEKANIRNLARGPDQPFYQVLVDVHEDPDLFVAYVPEENLSTSNQQDMDSFHHPYASFLFYGVDAAGDLIPIKQLREKCNQPRHELPYNPQSEEDGNGMDV